MYQVVYLIFTWYSKAKPVWFIVINFKKSALVKLCCCSSKHFNKKYCQWGKVCICLYAQTAVMGTDFCLAVIWLIFYRHIAVSLWLNGIAHAADKVKLRNSFGSPLMGAVVFSSFRNIWICSCRQLPSSIVVNKAAFTNLLALFKLFKELLVNTVLVCSFTLHKYASLYISWVIFLVNVLLI